MAAANLHSAQTKNHRLESFVFADAAARAAGTGYTLTADDVAKVGYQTDTGAYYRLTSHSPITWVEIAGGGMVTLTPASTTRNVVQPTADAVALELRPFSGGVEDPFRLRDAAGSTSLARLTYKGELYSGGLYPMLGSNPYNSTMVDADRQKICDGFYFPRLQDLNGVMMHDYQDEFAYLHRRASTTITLTPNVAASSGTTDNLFLDDTNTLAWNAGTAPYPIVLELDMSATPIGASGNGRYAISLTFRSSNQAADNPTNIKLDYWNSTSAAYETLFDGAPTWANAGLSVWTSLPYVSPAASSNLQKVRITLTGPATMTSTMRIQRCICYHATARWDPWRLHIGGGTMQGDITFHDAAVRAIIAGTTNGLKIGTATTQKLGFFNATPVVRPAALTQTYATADRTLSAYTPDVESSAYTGAADGEAQLADLNALRVAVENLRAFTEDAVQFLNAHIDDTQSLGFCG